MGYQSELAIVMEELRETAEGIAAQTRAVVRCPIHGDVATNNFDDEALTGAYKLANHKVTKGEIELTMGLTRRNLTDAIKDAVENSEIDCPHCASLFSKDD
jgi:hypothetical protein